MYAGELVSKSSATFDQIDRWISHGCDIGNQKRAGSGNRREFDEIDVKVCRFLTQLAPLIGSGRGAYSAAYIMMRVTEQLKANHDLFNVKVLYISTNAVIHTQPVRGWVVV